MAVRGHVFSLLAFLVSVHLFSPVVSSGGQTELEDESIAGPSTRLVRSENATAGHTHGKREAMVVSPSGTASSLMEVASHSAVQTGAVTGKIEMDFFTGSFPDGTRNDVSAHVGFAFSAHVDFRITSLGRKLNPHGVIVAEDNLTLWGPSHEVLAEIRVGPNDHKEGGYMWKELATPVDVKAHAEYRLTQECAAGMADPFWDGFLHTTSIHVHDQTAEAYADIGHGVSSNEAFKFPENKDGMGRRAGMLNFRINVVPTYARSRCCSTTACVRHAPLTGHLTFNQCMDKCRYAKHDLTLEGDACMGIEFGYANQCDTLDTCKCTLVREGGCGTYSEDVEWNFFTVAGPAHTVRLSQKHSGRVEVLHTEAGVREWGTVCENGFTELDAVVVCRQMQMWDGSVMPAQKLPGTGTGKIWMSEVMCEGGEPRIEECTFAGWGTHSCTHTQDVGVQCVKPMPGARGMPGPPGPRGVEADKNAADYHSTVVGPKGKIGPPGLPGSRGRHGINGNDGPPGFVLPRVEVFLDNSWNPYDSLVVWPVFILAALISVGATYTVWFFANENFVNPKRGKLQDFLKDKEEPWTAYYGKLSKNAGGKLRDRTDG